MPNKSLQCVNEQKDGCPGHAATAQPSPSKCVMLHPDATATGIKPGHHVKPYRSAQHSVSAHQRTAPSASPFPMQSNPQILNRGYCRVLGDHGPRPPHLHFAEANTGLERERVAKTFWLFSLPPSLTHPMPDHQRQRGRRVKMPQRQGSAGPRQESESQEPQRAGRRHLDSITWPRSPLLGLAREGLGRSLRISAWEAARTGVCPGVLP